MWNSSTCGSTWVVLRALVGCALRRLIVWYGKWPMKIDGCPFKNVIFPSYGGTCILCIYIYTYVYIYTYIYKYFYILYINTYVYIPQLHRQVLTCLIDGQKLREALHGAKALVASSWCRRGHSSQVWMRVSINGCTLKMDGLEWKTIYKWMI